MEARLKLLGNPAAEKVLKHLAAVGRALDESPLSNVTRELVLLRASQINGCGVCVDMHTKDAEHAGETSTRLHLVSAWREATVFTDAERAALELTEHATRIADAAGGVPDEVWDNAAAHYGEEELTALVTAIAVINAANRLNVITRQPAGGYRPGMFA
ncbi:carboxymuconolactone decarboxylase family protein [Nocardiopsis changdeensis]|uniref:carboxymuconolactone decarboxylase family protein n=1 Tax=Nocardiopsis changdeensis TaxID=2831969 RepID=UPI003F469AD9